MRRYLSAGLFAFVLLLSCSSSKQLEKRFTADDKTVFELIERLKKNPADGEAAELLPEAYKQAADLRKSINSSTYNNISEGDRWIEIANQLQVAQQMYTAIKSNSAASKVIPNPWNPALKIQEAKQKAAEEYYSQGLQYMAYNNRTYAQKAYDAFAKANNAYPNFRDVKNQMALALEKVAIKVLVRPVNYNRYGWNYWGFQNDYLQYKIVRDLNNSSYRNVRFYTEADMAAQRLPADRVVELNFNPLYIGQLYNDNNTIQRSKKIEVGQTKSLPAQPIYKTVYATVYVTRKILQSSASLDCRIYEWTNGRTILTDRFRDEYTWRQESGRYTGDSRALESSDWTIINNNSNAVPPSRNELAQRLVDNCYNQLLNRIKTGVNF